MLIPHVFTCYCIRFSPFCLFVLIYLGVALSCFYPDPEETGLSLYSCPVCCLLPCFYRAIINIPAKDKGFLLIPPKGDWQSLLSEDCQKRCACTSPYVKCQTDNLHIPIHHSLNYSRAVMLMRESRRLYLTTVPLSNVPRILFLPVDPAHPHPTVLPLAQDR